MKVPVRSILLTMHKVRPHEKNTGIFWNFPQHGGGGDLPNSQNFVILTIALKKTSKHLKITQKIST